MKRLTLTIISMLLLSTVVIPVAHAGGSGTDTCPVDGDRCVGSGGSAGR